MYLLTEEVHGKPVMATETYVISIYRRGGEAGKDVTGLAERTGSGERKAFSSSKELWTFLSGKPASQTHNPQRTTIRGSKDRT